MGNLESEPVCIACDSTTSFVERAESEDLRYGSQRTFSVLECSNCGLCFTHPKLSWEELTDHYPEEYYKYRDENDVKKPTYGGHPLDKITAPATLIDDLSPGSMLEVGCGTGDTLAYWDKNGWECSGVEPSAVAAEIASDRHGLTVSNKRFDQTDFEEDSFDVVLFDNVLEHLHKPFEAINQSRRLLKQGGALVIEVPNINSLGFQLFGQFWSDLDLPRHLFHFSPDVLQREANNRGFRLDTISHTGYPISLRYSLNRFLEMKFGWEVGRWVSLPLLPIALLGRLEGQGDHFRARYRLR